MQYTDVYVAWLHVVYARKQMREVSRVVFLVALSLYWLQ